MLADDITIADLENDPYPVYAHLRQTAPIAYIPAANVWFATRMAEVEAITKFPARFSPEAATSPVSRSFGTPNILTTEGPVHAELRGGIEPHYRPRAVAGYVEALVRPIAESYLARIAGSGAANLMAEYFEPISTLSLARSFGFDDIDEPQLRRWFYGLSQGAINYEGDVGRQAISDRTCAEIDAVVLPILHRLARSPEPSPLSHMLHSGMPDGQTRPPEMILPTVKVTLLGGMQEPGHGAGSVLTGLLSNPAQMAMLRDNMDEWLPRAVDEGLRWVAPIGTQMRVARQDEVLAGVTIPAGAPIAAILASANHDETVFTHPGRFDMTRPKASHAAFGYGNHFCAGKWFAKAQIEIALRLLLQRYPALRLDPDRLPEFRGWEFRAPTSLFTILE